MNGGFSSGGCSRNRWRAAPALSVVNNKEPRTRSPVCVSNVHDPAYTTCEYPPFPLRPRVLIYFLLPIFSRRSFTLSHARSGCEPRCTTSINLNLRLRLPSPLAVLLQRPARHRSSMLVALLDCTARRNLHTERTGARRGLEDSAVAGRRRRDLGAAMMSAARVH